MIPADFGRSRTWRDAAERWGKVVNRQQTVAEKVTCNGVGLHCGVPLQLALQPARANTGVVFARRDATPSADIAARPSAVVGTSHATTLAGEDGTTVTTVEHLLAALYSLGIDNVRLELDGPEVPVLDGSSEGFVQLIRSAGIFRQKEPRGVLEIRQPLEVRDGDRVIRVEPAQQFGVQYAVEFDHPVIGRQELSFSNLDEQVFRREIARARTFGFLNEVSELLRAGLAQGGSLENTVVLDHDRVLNTNGLRWPDEFVRHKILDLLGDLSLLGLPVQGHVVVERGGHALHQMLVQQILHTPDAWTIRGEEPGFPRSMHLMHFPS